LDEVQNMLALRAKTKAGWVLVHALSLSEFLFFRYLKSRSTWMCCQNQIL